MSPEDVARKATELGILDRMSWQTQELAKQMR